MSQIRHPLPAATCVAIEYPGYVRDEEQALITLGGEAAINAAVSSNWALRLSFRPSDPTTHPLYGERAPCCRMLLRISRRRPQAPDLTQSNGNISSNDHTSSAAPMDIDASSSSPAADNAATSAPLPTGADDIVHAVVVARIATVFTFPGLADFQFLPFDPALESRGHDALPFEHLPEKAEPTRTRQPYLMSPPTFTIKDTPFEYDFQPGREQTAAMAGSQPTRRILPATTTLEPMASAAAAARKLTDATSSGAGANRHQIHSAVFACTTVPQPSKARAAPTDGSGGEPDGYVKTDGEVLAQHVDQILSGRPIWSPALLLETVNARLAAAAAKKALLPGTLAAEPARRCTVAQLEAVVRSRCYQFTSGPWFKTFILLGHDPRKEPSSRRLQTISYTLPTDWFLHITPPAATSEPLDDAIALEAAAKGLIDANREPLPKSGKRGQPVPSSMTDILRFKALPTSRSIWLQLTDLQDDKIQHLLSRTDATKRCNESHGWLTVHITEQLKKMVAERFDTLMAEQPADREQDRKEEGHTELEPLDMDASSYQDTVHKLSKADLSSGGAKSAQKGADKDSMEEGQEEAGDTGGDGEAAGAEDQEAGGEDGVAAAAEEEEELEWDGGSGEGDQEYDDGGDADDDGEFFM